MGQNKTRIDWSVWPLGLVSDGCVAQNTGMSAAAVLYARRVRGIPAFEGHKKVADWKVQPLGEVRDYILAYRLGVSRQRVFQVRRARRQAP